MSTRSHRSRQSGLTYVELMVATVILVIALVPALKALHTGMLGAEIYESSSSQHYAVLAKMKGVLAERHEMLTAAAAVAGNPKTPSSYSDAAGLPDRRLVYLGLYDANNADGDNNVFTVLDPNLDGDSNPFTGYRDLLWVRVAIEGSIVSVESLTLP